MSRYNDIKECLGCVNNDIYEVKKLYEEARKDLNINNAPRVKVKGILENLRSTLDYCANDISDHTGKRGRKVYFPYGKKKSAFDGSVNASFPGLISGDVEFYKILKSIQPFELGDDWLYSICKMTNDNKHNKLSEYNRVNSEEKTLRVGPITFGPQGSAKIGRIEIDGKVLNPQGEVFLSSKMGVEDVMEVIDTELDVTSTYEWVEFHVDNKGVDVLKVLEKGNAGIMLFVESLYSVLPR